MALMKSAGPADGIDRLQEVGRPGDLVQQPAAFSFVCFVKRRHAVGRSVLVGLSVVSTAIGHDGAGHDAAGPDRLRVRATRLAVVAGALAIIVIPRRDQ
jgi:hypothetical protein